jgi:hypothetical protein
VPLGGVAPGGDTVASLAYPEAFPVSLVVTRAAPAGPPRPARTSA